LASGGGVPVRTFNGKALALRRARPAASAKSFGSSITSSASCGNRARETSRPCTVLSESSEVLSSVGLMAPLGPTSRICSAILRVTGALNCKRERSDRQAGRLGVFRARS